MLKLVEENQIDEILTFLHTQGAIATRIGAYLKCYRTQMNFVYFWVQKQGAEISAVVSKVDGDMTVCTTDRTDFDEVKEFASIIGFNTLFMSVSAFRKMELIPDKTGDILEFTENTCMTMKPEISSRADMKRAYELFTKNQSEGISAFEYLPWLSDFSYKRNRNSARIICVEDGEKQICFAMTSAETDFTALISGVVTDNLHRNKGYASFLVNKLANDLKSENKAVYIMTATDNHTKFYENNGFICIGRWGMIDRKI